MSIEQIFTPELSKYTTASGKREGDDGFHLEVIREISKANTNLYEIIEPIIGGDVPEDKTMHPFNDIDGWCKEFLADTANPFTKKFFFRAISCGFDLPYQQAEQDVFLDWVSEKCGYDFKEQFYGRD